MISISLNKIKKYYNNQKVFENFSYSFKDKGLYLLYGPSGCGKTTLINMLYGICDYSEGSISINGKAYQKCVSNNDIKDSIAYITQNAYFVDYLSIKDNLKLCLSNDKSEEYINELSEHFKVDKLLDRKPNTLSGGEKQRFSIMRALIQSKSIILMDEPTSAMDPDNRKIIFDILGELKKDILIICASHDEDMLSLADETIEYENIESYSKDSNEITTTKKYVKEKHKQSLLYYVFKQGIYRKHNRLATVLMCFIFVLSLLTIYLTSDFESKIFNSIVSNNDINIIPAIVSVKGVDYLYENKDKYDIKEIGLNETESIASLKPKNSLYEAAYLESEILYSLPTDEEDFPTELIGWGTYFNNEHDIIIGYALYHHYADTPDEALGEKIIQKNGLGETEYTICGVLKEDTGEYMYLNVLDENSDVDYYAFTRAKDMEYELNNLNDIYYLDDNFAFKVNIIFNSTDGLRLLYEEFTDNYEFNDIKIVKLGDIMTNLRGFLNIIDPYITPIIIVAFLVSFLFYFQTKSSEMAHSKYNISMYMYYGYSSIRIKLTYIIFFVIESMIKVIFSIICSIILMYLFNIINNILEIFSFTPFMIDFHYTFLFIFAALITSIVLSTILMIITRSNQWYNLLKERRDVI